MKKCVKAVSAFLVVAFCLLSVPSCSFFTDESKQQFRVGMASVDITPTKDVYLEGYLKPGDAMCLAKYPDDFTSNLMARVLVIDNGEDTLVFVNMEILINYLKLFSDLKQNIADICKTSADKVFLSNTHNHQSNTLDFDSVTQIKIQDAVREAYERMEPAVMGIDAAPSSFVVSRGTNLGVNMDMPVDNMLTVVRFDNAETGQPIGMVWNVPIHNTMLSNGYPQNYNQLSCEVSGYASRFLEGVIHQENEYFTAMCIIGFTGNTGPSYNGKFNAANPTELKEAGEALGVQCLNLYDTIESTTLGGDIASMVGMGNLPRSSDPLKETVYGTDVLISTGSFADVLYFGVNYEVFSVIGSRLKAESPYRYIIPAGVSNGSNAYLPTKEAFDLPAYYETTSAATCLGPEAEEIFYALALETACKTAGVTLDRISGNTVPVAMDGGAAVYAFDYSEDISPEKLVISFDQKSRNDCASDFELKLYNRKDKEVFSQTFKGYSTNYIGVMLDDVKFSRAELIVTRRWQSGEFVTEGIDTLTPNVYGVVYTPIN